jgi:hypothetical protein
MEILVYVLVFIALVFWFTRKFPDSNVTKQITGLLSRKADKVGDEATATTEPTQATAEKPTSPDLVVEQTVDTQPIIEPVKIDSVVAKVTSAVVEPQIPEDSVLRRHYLASLDAERKALTHPYPTDSVLRRHHESMHAVFVKPAAKVIPEQTTAAIPAIENHLIPEDSVLRRHFLSELANKNL